MFTAGACIQWLRDGVQVITNAAETEAPGGKPKRQRRESTSCPLSAASVPPTGICRLAVPSSALPAAPSRNHIVRSVLEAIAYEVKEVVDAVNEDAGTPIRELKVDGGACNNNFLMQFQADVLGIPVERPEVLDVTAQGGRLCRWPRRWLLG